MRWAIVDANGKIVNVLEASKASIITANCPPDHSAHECPALEVNADAWKWSGTGFALIPVPTVVPETAEKALDRMISTIDGERETRMMTDFTDGGAKKYEYAEKAREVRDYRSLGGVVVAGLLLPLNIAGTRDRFAWSMAEADETGDSLETVITRYETAMRLTQLSRKVAARAQKLKRQLRFATAGARPAIFAARTWPA